MHMQPDQQKKKLEDYIERHWFTSWILSLKMGLEEKNVTCWLCLQEINVQKIEYKTVLETSERNQAKYAT